MFPATVLLSRIVASHSCAFGSLWGFSLRETPTPNLPLWRDRLSQDWTYFLLRINSFNKVFLVVSLSRFAGCCVFKELFPVLPYFSFVLKQKKSSKRKIQGSRKKAKNPFRFATPNNVYYVLIHYYHLFFLSVI